MKSLNGFKYGLIGLAITLFSGLANAAAMTNYLENKLIDAFLRGQSYTMPATVYVGLFTVCPTDSTAGTEVTGGDYGREDITSSLANWSGTQSDGSTTASSGTGGTTKNNATITFATASADWGTVVCFGVFDASTSGNLLFYAALTANRTITNGSTASFAPYALTFQIDN
jgi:hypothetical protein